MLSGNRIYFQYLSFLKLVRGVSAWLKVTYRKVARRLRGGVNFGTNMER
jgi:hypothetical protein